MNPKKGILIGLLFAFLVMGILSMQRAMPEEKNERIYKAVKIYSPYTLEKRIGGLTIINTQTGDKEKPSAADVLLRLDELDKEWGKSHLQVIDKSLIVLGENNQTIVKIFIETENERAFIKSFYGI
ncbi:MAG: hypothetical protein AUK54_09180 [Helicobacteraceae bacterium CG2_30_36_10]|nr:MAG: hypothetical protein AUK54_09180 [Helicobacteraceae bacterium CG2_30_36_10]